MTPDQLQAARAAHWRQQENPLLTLEEVEQWLAQHPLCLFLPRPAQLRAPAPSLVEACLGRREATPDAAAIAQAHGWLTRLAATDTVVGLNLLGAVTEQPDFVAHRDALPYVICLRADADWKQAPKKSSGHKVSPLVLELWKALEQAGTRTAGEAREALGRELTEAAVLRGLCELWQGLRITPVERGEGEGASWEMLRVKHRAALTLAGATSQVTALSLLVSMYLQSVYAATSEEVEVFLSPVASRSRVREAVRGLAATRQIQSLSMDAATYYFLENGLPEFAVASTEEAVAEAPAAARSMPIFRRPGQEIRPEIRTRIRAEVRPVMQVRAERKPASSEPGGLPRRQPAAGRPAGATGGKKEYGARAGSNTRPAGTWQQDRGPAGKTTRPYAKPARPPFAAGGRARPETGTGQRPRPGKAEPMAGASAGPGFRSKAGPGFRSKPSAGFRPGARPGSSTRPGEKPKPWALPKRSSAGSAARPGGAPGAGAERKSRGSGAPRTFSRDTTQAPGGGRGRPYPGKQTAGGPRTGGQRTGGQPSTGSRPAARFQPSGAANRPRGPVPYGKRPGARFSSTPISPRPAPGSAAGRPPSTAAAAPGARRGQTGDRPTNRAPGGYGRSRAGGSAKPGSKPAWSQKAGDRPTNRVPGSRPGQAGDRPTNRVPGSRPGQAGDRPTNRVPGSRPGQSGDRPTGRAPGGYGRPRVGGSAKPGSKPAWSQKAGRGAPGRPAASTGSQTARPGRDSFRRNAGPAAPGRSKPERKGADRRPANGRPNRADLGRKDRDRKQPGV